MEILSYQYELIRARRETLFGYCETLSPQHFTVELEAFGTRSICSLKIHVANTYKYWLGHFTGIDQSDLAESERCSNVAEVRALFTETNALVKAFLDKVDGNFNEPILRKVPLRDFELSLTPLQLFTQVITHEFHHKGQILAMSRQLGYQPIDTDIIRFD